MTGIVTECQYRAEVSWCAAVPDYGHHGHPIGAHGMSPGGGREIFVSQDRIPPSCIIVRAAANRQSLLLRRLAAANAAL